MKIYIAILVSLAFAPKTHGRIKIEDIGTKISKGIKSVYKAIGVANNASKLVAHKVANATRSALIHFVNQTGGGLAILELTLEFGKVKAAGGTKRQSVYNVRHGRRGWLDFIANRILWAHGAINRVNEKVNKMIDIVDESEDGGKGPIRKLFDTVRLKAVDLSNIIFNNTRLGYANKTYPHLPTPISDPENKKFGSSTSIGKGSFQEGNRRLFLHKSKPARPTAIKDLFPNLKNILTKTRDNFNEVDNNYENDSKQDDDRQTNERMPINNIIGNEKNEIETRYNKNVRPSQNENEVTVLQGPVDYAENYMHYNDFNNNAISFAIDFNNSSNVEKPSKQQEDRFKELLDNSLL